MLLFVTANLLFFKALVTFCQFCRRPESSCWFCLSSPDVESDLIINLGENYYCALAKGPLVESHVLLVPIEHSPNTLIMTSEAEKELEKYKNALSVYFEKQEKVVVYFEYAFQNNRHANLQVKTIIVAANQFHSLHLIFDNKQCFCFCYYTCR